MTLTIALAFIFSLFYSLFILLQQQFLRIVIPPLQLNFFNHLSAVIFLSIFIFLIKPSLIKSVPKAGLKYAILVGLTASVFGDSLLYLGLKFSSAINWGILSLLIALVTFILAIKFLAEKSTRGKIIALMLSLVGAFIVIYRPGEKVLFIFTDLFFIAAVFMYAGANILNQKALKYLSIFQLLYFRLLSAVIVLGIVVFFSAPVIKNLPWAFIVINSLWLILGVSLVNLIIKRAGPTFFSLSLNLVPVFTVVFAAVLFKEMATIYQLTGGVLVIGSIVIFNKKF